MIKGVVCLSIRDAYQFLVDHYPLYQLRNKELAADHDGLNGPQKQFQRGIEAMEGAMTDNPTPLASAGRAAAVEQGFNPEFTSLMAQYLKNQDKITERQQTSIDTLTTAVTTQRGDISTLTTSMTTLTSNVATINETLTSKVATINDQIGKMSEVANATESKVDAFAKTSAGNVRELTNSIQGLRSDHDEEVSVLTKAINDMRHDHAKEMKDVLRKLQQAMGKSTKGATWTKEEEDILVAAYHKYMDKNGRLRRTAMLEELQQTIGKYRTVNSIVSKAGRLVKSDAEAPPAPKETRKGRRRHGRHVQAGPCPSGHARGRSRLVPHRGHCQLRE